MPSSGKATVRRAWSIPVENVWVPFFTATNVMGETNVAPEVLGAPLRLSKTSDGEIRFTKSGRPSVKVESNLNAQIGIVRENFVASLEAYAGTVQHERGEDYAKAVMDAQAAALPIVEQETSEVNEAYELMRQAAHTEPQKPKAESMPEVNSDGSESTPQEQGKELATVS